MALPLDGYIRVSQVGGREGEGFISPDVQEAAIRKWAERSGREVQMQPAELNVSGGTMDRPIFNDIIERIHDGRSGGLVVFKLDRFSRSLIGAITTLADLGKHGALFASASEPELDYSTPAGQAFMHTLFTFAEFTRSTLKESWHVAQRSATERGIHISPNGFPGYDRVDRRLVPNELAPTIVEIFVRRGAGETWQSLADWLNEVAPLEGGRLWNGQRVQRLCSKRVYRGEASRYVVQDADGRGPIVNKDAHPALVTEKVWLAAQMNPHIARGGHKKGDTLPLLSGLVRCAGCRYGMTRAPGGSGKNLYTCRPRKSKGTCEAPASIRADKIEEYVEGLLVGELEQLMAQAVQPSASRDAALAGLERAREDLDEFRRDTDARRELGDLWLDTLKSYSEKVREAERVAERVVGQAGAIEDQLTAEHYLDLPLADRRDVLGGFVDAVMVGGRGADARTRVLWRGEGPTDLPRPRVASPVVPFDLGKGEVEVGVATA